MPMPLQLKLPPWRHLLSYRLAGPLAVSLAALVIATTELGNRASTTVNADRDASVESRLTVMRARRSVLQMESAQRGYTLTGRPEYREPFDRTVSQTADLVQSLRKMAEQSPRQRAALTELVDAVRTKVSEVSELVRLYDSGERNRAVALMLTDIGREQMERINDLADQVLLEEEQAYAGASAQRDRVRLWSRVTLYSLALLSVVVAFAIQRVVGQRDRERARHLVEISRERTRLEDEVERRTRDLSDLARHLQTVREDERSHLARELHDELGGLLTAAKLDVTLMRKRLSGTSPELVERITHLTQSLDAGIALKRRIIEDLRPSSLANLGLQKTLEFLCADFAKRADIKVEASIAELDLSDDRELAIYRIVQEALTNIAKYAKAKSVRVSLRLLDGQALVEVRDDGVGFDPTRMREGAHGLSGMRFRVQSFGGAWQLQSAPGQGTLVQAHIPLQEMPGDEDSPGAGTA